LEDWWWPFGGKSSQRMGKVLRNDNGVWGFLISELPAMWWRWRWRDEKQFL
jgi:hypothetical protein